MIAKSLTAPFAPSRSRVFEPFSVLAAAATVGLVWWMGVRPAPETAQPVCKGGDHVSYAQVDGARQRVLEAETAWREAQGPALTRARVGTPPGEASQRATAAATERDAARRAWAEVCG